MTPPDGSPATFPYSGHFSDEDIHELLGAMDAHDHHDSCADQHEDVPEPDTLHSTTPNDPEVDTSISEEARAQARSERKRTREKQRRNDVNKQFADLSQLLKRIEEEDMDAEGTAWLSSIPLGGPTNRVDLVARAIAVLERMHDMNGKSKREIASLNQQLEDMKKMAEDTAARLKEATLYQQGPSKQVMMMVPMMVSQDQMQGGPFAMASPFMQQPHGLQPQQPQAYCPMPQMAASQAMPAAMMPQASMFPQMMFASTAPPPPPAPAPPTATTMQLNHAQPTQQQPQNQQQQQKQPANMNGGANLAHCA